jgi:hypothetical protein
LLKKVFRSICLTVLPESWTGALRTYNYQIEIYGISTIIGELGLFYKNLFKAFKKRKVILFYPDSPRDFHVLFKILKFLGAEITNDPDRCCDIAIKWWRAPDGNPFSPIKSFPVLRPRKSKDIVGINFRCNDTSKLLVNREFEKVFGYALSIDPTNYEGKCVMKLNGNGLHKGRVIQCPTDKIEKDYVYQKLIGNETENGLVEDIRVPVFKSVIPFVYIKRRSVKDRLVDRAHTNTFATLEEVRSRLNEEEISKILEFCKGIGLDYGEVDVLRDRKDGRIYIIDVNNFPSGPPSPISHREGNIAIQRLANAFEKAFMLKSFY